MQDVQSSVDMSYQDLSLEDWKQTIIDITDEHGAYQALNDTHFAAFVEAGKTLLVTFECTQDLRENGSGRPLGHDFILSDGWSHLGVFSDSQSWFRDGRIYGYFDRLIDDGFFEDFDQVLFYGKGAAGYAAAAFSVAAPGAQVLVLNPHATMDPRMTEWDPRYPQARRLQFTDRFGYAPDMLDAANAAFVLYDPYEDLDAMHAALFERSNVTRLRVPFLGQDLETELSALQILVPLIRQVAEGTMDQVGFAQLFRTRRNSAPYQRRLLAQLDARGRPALSHALCRHVLSTRSGRAPYFQRRLRQLTKLAAKGAFKPLPELPPRSAEA